MDLPLLYNQLIRIDGLDIWNGLSHVGCNRAVYADTLRLFCVEVERKTAAATEFLEQENWKDYTITVHALKGGFTGVGAWKIAPQIRELETAVRNKDYALCREQTGGIFAVMLAFTAALKATALFDRDQQSKEPAPLSYLTDKFNALHWACFSANCTEADALVRELRTKTFDPKTDALVETVCQLAENMDYNEALKDIDDWLALTQPA